MQRPLKYIHSDAAIRRHVRLENENHRREEDEETCSKNFIMYVCDCWSGKLQTVTPAGTGGNPSGLRKFKKSA